MKSFFAIALLFFLIISVKVVFAYDGAINQTYCDGPCFSYFRIWGNNTCDAAGNSTCTHTMNWSVTGGYPTNTKIGFAASNKLITANSGSLTFTLACGSYTPKIYVNGRDMWDYFSVNDVNFTNCQSLSMSSTSISSSSVETNGTSQYDISATATYTGGYTGIDTVQFFFDSNSPVTTARGYVYWAKTMSTGSVACLGNTANNGYVVEQPNGSYGQEYLNLGSTCSVTGSGNNLTVNTKVSFNQFPASPTNFKIYGLASRGGNNTGWIWSNGWANFSLVAAPTIVGTSKGDAGTATYASVATGDIPGDRYRNVSSANWKAKTDASSLSKYGYSYWYNMLFSKIAVANFLTSPIFNSSTTLAGKANGIYFSQGDMTITDAQSITTANKNLVFLVNGNLLINNRILRQDKSTFLAFFVSGDIIVDRTVSGLAGTPGLDGVYLTDKSIILNGSGSESQLLLNGIFYTKSGVANSRSLGSNDGTSPAVIFQFDPSLVLNAPTELMKPKYSWQEIAP